MQRQAILLLIWIGFMAVMSMIGNFKQEEVVCGQKVLRTKALFAFIVFAPIIWMAANRGWFADTTLYILNYLNMPDSLSQLPTYFATLTKDKGFYVLSFFLKLILGSGFKPYLFVLALFQGISVVYFFRKYSSDYIISIFLFVASTDYLSWMFNGLRQFMAVTIILFATSYMLEKKYFPVVCAILLASTMHKSALLMIPFVFIAQGEPWNKKTLILIFIVLLAVGFTGEFTTLLDDSLSKTQYVNVVSDYQSFNDDGTNPLRVLVYSLPALLSLFGLRYIKNAHNPLINFCVNMSIISMGLYVISMVTSGIFIGRLPIYCSLFGYILLPWEIDYIFNEKSAILIKIMMVLSYLAFYYYSLFMAA